MKWKKNNIVQQVSTPMYKKVLKNGKITNVPVKRPKIIEQHKIEKQKIERDTRDKLAKIHINNNMNDTQKAKAIKMVELDYVKKLGKLSDKTGIIEPVVERIKQNNYDKKIKNARIDVKREELAILDPTKKTQLIEISRELSAEKNPTKRKQLIESRNKLLEKSRQMILDEKRNKELELRKKYDRLKAIQYKEAQINKNKEKINKLESQINPKVLYDLSKALQERRELRVAYKVLNDRYQNVKSALLSEISELKNQIVGLNLELKDEQYRYEKAMKYYNNMYKKSSDKQALQYKQKLGMLKISKEKDRLNKLLKIKEQNNLLKNKISQLEKENKKFITELMKYKQKIDQKPKRVPLPPLGSKPSKEKLKQFWEITKKGFDIFTSEPNMEYIDNTEYIDITDEE